MSTGITVWLTALQLWVIVTGLRRPTVRFDVWLQDSPRLGETRRKILR
jgi:hypothetical protein